MTASSSDCCRWQTVNTLLLFFILIKFNDNLLFKRHNQILSILFYNVPGIVFSDYSNKFHFGWWIMCFGSCLFYLWKAVTNFWRESELRQQQYQPRICHVWALCLLRFSCCVHFACTGFVYWLAEAENLTFILFATAK